MIYGSPIALENFRAFQKMPDKKRSVTLSVDWDRMVKDLQESDGLVGNKISVLQLLKPHNEERVNFCTGSKYTGKYNKFGMTERGTYRFPQGCEYEGGFEDGMFHGEGTLMYPMGQKLEGMWEKGQMIAYKFQNIDGLDYNDNWSYCVMPDRRFNVSIREGLQPAGREFMTNQQPERPLQPGYYDTGDGYYNPVTRSIITARDPDDYAHLEDRDSSLMVIGPPKTNSDEGAIDEDMWLNAISMVSDDRHEWIIKHCRKGWDEPTGYRPDLYEDWISGRKDELEKLNQKYNPRNLLEENSTISSDNRSSGDPSVAIDEQKSIDYAGTGRKLSPSYSKNEMND